MIFGKLRSRSTILHGILYKSMIFNGNRGPEVLNPKSRGPEVWIPDSGGPASENYIKSNENQWLRNTRQ